MLLNIADINFKIETEGTPFKIASAYLNFLVENAVPDVLIIIVDLEEENASPEEYIYRAENIFNDPLNLFSWCVAITPDGFVFDFFDSNKELSCRATSNLEFTNWKVAFSDRLCDMEILGYPHGPVILHAIFSAFDAFYLHASAVSDASGAFVFSGKSGKGKSTISRILSSKYSVINDDRIIIRRIGNNFFVFNSPLYEGGGMVKVPLNKMFFIEHGKTNSAVNLSFAEAITNIMANSIQHNFSQKILSQRLDMIYEMVHKHGVYRLSFVPDDSVCDIIDNV